MPSQQYGSGDDANIYSIGKVYGDWLKCSMDSYERMSYATEPTSLTVGAHLSQEQRESSFRHSGFTGTKKQPAIHNESAI